MHIVADENIPFVKHAFGTLGKVTLLAGQRITPESVRDADLLLVRSITRVDEHLIDGSRLRFVGTATIGTDHVDLPALEKRGIAFAHAPGSNADSVVEYVIASLLVLSTRRGETLRGKTIGIVGCGNIGSRLARRLPALGLNVLKNDPPLAEKAEAEGRAHEYVSLDRVLAESDIVTLHVPLTKTGPHATVHLMSEGRLAQMKSTAWLINSCRGAVVSNPALTKALTTGTLSAAVLDVWENEPTPSADLLRRVDLGTPHIAGYSYDGKVNGTIQLYEAVTRAFGLDHTWDPETVLAWSAEDHPYLTPPNDRVDPRLPGLSEVAWLDALVLQMYDIVGDDIRMRGMLALPESSHAQRFHDLRKYYPRRRTFARHVLSDLGIPERFRPAVREALLVQPGD